MWTSKERGVGCGWSRFLYLDDELVHAASDIYVTVQGFGLCLGVYGAV